MMKGTFFMPDGTPGEVIAAVYGNVTQVTIIVNPSKRYKIKDRQKQFFGGLAYCNPKDKFDVETGVKVACKAALEIGACSEWYHPRRMEYHREIYSAIRRWMGAKG